VYRCRRVDGNQKKNQPALAKQARASEKKRAGRRIHEIVLPRTKEKNLVAREHMFAGVVPELVIKEVAAAKVMQQRQRGKHSRRRDKDEQHGTKPERAAESLVKRPERIRGHD